jgi:hypothetical protein
LFLLELVVVLLKHHICFNLHIIFDLNPRHIFSTTATQLLCEALRGNYDIIYLIRKELANRGVDKEGKWVGFDKAGKIHGIR